MEILKTTDLCKTYVINKRQNNVLRNVNLSINEGEMIGVMGPSGSGKTTLLYTISGMDGATAGKIDFFGKDLTKLGSNEMSDLRLQKMGFIFQQMYMMKNLTIYDNIVLPAYQANKSSDRNRINERARKLMKKLGISDVADNEITEVSGGQLQRACIARSMINEPKIIFADEPTGALNRQNSTEVMEELNKLNAEGVTMMIVTHDAKVASRCEKIYYIEDGNIRDEYHLGKFSADADYQREKELNNWLMKLGW